MKKIVLLLFAVCWVENAQPAESFDGFFRQGLSAYQAKKFDEAAGLFAKAAEIEPNNPAAWSNLGLSFASQQKFAPALAYFRQALWLKANDPTATAGAAAAFEKMEVKEIPHRSDFSVLLRKNLLEKISTQQLWLISFLSFLLLGWIATGRNRKTRMNSFIFSAFLFLTCFSALLLQLWDRQTPHATIVEKKITAVSAPETTGVPIFDLFEGLDVEVKQVQKDWLQVTYPGALTGWIPRNTAIITSKE